MKQLSQEEFIQRLTTCPQVEADETDIAMLNEASKINDGATLTREEIENELQQEHYNGKILVRIPRSLHKELAEQAKAEGVSLNQYALFKLSH